MTTKCKINNCNGIAGLSGTALGLCRSHYKRYHRYGNPEVELRKVDSWKGQTCHYVGCDREIYGLGLCSMHHARQRRNNDPIAEKKRQVSWRSRRLARQEAALGRPRPPLCEMCSKPPTGRGNKPGVGICFDHCHSTGKARGWLCDRCNKTLGLVADSAVLLRKMAAYLEEHNGKIKSSPA